MIRNNQNLSDQQVNLRQPPGCPTSEAEDRNPTGNAAANLGRAMAGPAVAVPAAATAHLPSLAQLQLNAIWQQAVVDQDPGQGEAANQYANAWQNHQAR